MTKSVIHEKLRNLVGYTV